jgi:DNA-binding response OmpR family regulator
MKRLLLVDDDDDFREIVCDALVYSGYDIVGVEGGVAALAWLSSNAPPDLILLDLMMPGMGGAELKERLDRAPAYASVPVLVLSGDTRLAERTAAMGAAGWICKPVTLHDLLARIEAQLAAGQDGAARGA